MNRQLAGQLAVVCAAICAVACGQAEPVVNGADAGDVAADAGALADAAAAPDGPADATVAADLAEAAVADVAAELGQDAPADAAQDELVAADSGSPADAAAAAEVAADAALVPQCATAADCPALPCQLATCNAKGQCGSAAAADNSPCSDGNACTTQDTCAAGACAGAGKLQCDDDNPCTADKCNALSGCVNLPLPASTACDDGDACTANDTCQAGKCSAGTPICQCQTTSDCGKFEDGDACNGTLYCDKSAGAPYTCKINPASLVVCPKTNDNLCQTNKCLPATGECKLVTAPPNTPCDDGDKCTLGDFCDSGLCLGGANACYCKKDADCAASEDGNLCNGTLFCNKATSQCQINPVTVVTCKTGDNTFCSENLCNPKDGKCYFVPVHEGKACDDGNACTPNETCSKGQCATATNTCECQSDADCAKKEDGNLCNGTLYCDVKANKCTVNPATVVGCDTSADPACLLSVCDPKSGQCGQVALPKDGTACDDGNPCTPNSTCSGGACKATVNTCECQSDGDCLAKEDGDLCNGTLYCDKQAGKCAVNPATVVLCPTAFDEDCLTNQCDPKTGGCGMKPAHQGNQCGQVSACSGAGWCKLGTCADKPPGAICECQTNSDCAQFEDGNSCNGTLYCDLSGSKPVCKVNPASQVVCKSVDDSACLKNECSPKTGACTMTEQTGACDDGKACTLSDACKSGQCVGLKNGCDDGDPCTGDSCVEPNGCAHLPVAASTCDDANPCTGDACAAKVGCTHKFIDNGCDDGDACTAGDSCSNGACAGSKANCDDANPCTQDACVAKVGCLATQVTGTCNDGNACTASDMCNNGKCIGVKTACDDGNPCTDDNCDAKTGCSNLPNASACDDGNSCTAKDACKAGVCSGYLFCNDNNPCTDDSCSGKNCAYANNTLPCNDNNACTVDDACAAGKCAAGLKLDCDDKNPCTSDSCDAGSGCLHGANSVACDDGNACTGADSCALGACAGKKITCDDGNPCTDDACDPAKGCTATANLFACTDGNACTLNDACAAGKCVAGKAVDCDDGNFCTLDGCNTLTGQCSHADNAAKVCDDGKICTDDLCDGKLGCAHPFNTAPCDDGNACTLGDVCSFSVCKNGALAVCDDKNLCTDDSCDPKLGCVYAQNTKACDDGNGCTQKDVCAKGNCAGVLTCNDNNPCTEDSCDFKAGQCAYANNADACDDGDACTSQSHCKGGVCTGELATVCDDNNYCTDNACDKLKGCNYPNNTLPCDSGSCTGEDLCGGGKCVSSGKQQYFEKTYNDTAASEWVEGIVPLPDGALGTGRARPGNFWIGAKSYLWRWGRAGTLLWRKQLNTDIANIESFAMTKLGNGQYVVVGSQDPAATNVNGTAQGYWQTVDADGNAGDRKMFGLVMNDVTPNGTPFDDYPQAVAAAPGTANEFVICGFGSTCKNGCNEDGFVIAYSADGTEGKHGFRKDANQLHQRIYGCAFGGNGNLVTVGWNDDGGGFGQWDGDVVSWNYPAMTIAKATRIGTGYYEVFYGVTALTDGTLLAVGWHDPSHTPWMVRLSATGDAKVESKLWEKQFTQYTSVDLYAAVALPDNGAVAIGQHQTQMYLTRIDETGYEVANKVIQGDSADKWPRCGTRDSMGAIWAAGAHTVSYTPDAWVNRLDPWLNNQCIQACATKKGWADCDDGNQCTTDYCGNDCAHAGNTGVVCSDGNACTASDACVAQSSSCVGVAINCDDKNPCTQDSCPTDTGCKHVTYADGFVCGTGLTCKAGTCGP